MKLIPWVLSIRDLTLFYISSFSTIYTSPSHLPFLCQHRVHSCISTNVTQKIKRCHRAKPVIIVQYFWCAFISIVSSLTSIGSTILEETMNLTFNTRHIGCQHFLCQWYSLWLATRRVSNASSCPSYLLLL